MAVTVKQLIPAKNAESVQTTQYTATNVKAIVDKATVTNTTAANLSLSVNILPSSGSASSSNLIVKTRSIAPNECYTLPEMVGQVIETGGSISTLASGSGLTIAFSGREIS